MSFFNFRQNNSGGFWTGPAINLIVEASTEEEANRIAESHGVYFDGSNDCPCCGSRWSETWEETPSPMIYRTSITENIEDTRKWGNLYKQRGVPYAMVVYANGVIETHEL